MNDPDRIRINAPNTAATANLSVVGLGLDADAVELIRAPFHPEIAATIRHASSSSATPRWNKTTHQASSVNTVTPPRMAATITRTKAAMALRRTTGLSRKCSHDRAAVAATNRLRTDAERRWLYSIRVGTLNGGMICPWHRGQSGQPSPESVTLTTPPKVTWPNAAITAATTTVRKMICALALRNVSGGLRLSYWNRRQNMPNVQYFTNERIAQAPTIVNPMTEGELYLFCR